MQINGLSISDFADQKEALKTADEIIADNKAEYGHQEETKIHKNPLISNYFYVKSDGKKRSWEQVEQKDFSGSTDTKTQNNMQDMGVFMEGMGDLGSGGPNSSVKVEFVAHSKLLQAKDSCRSL